MYKVGEKVETPFGIGIVVGKRVAMRHDDIIFEVEIKGIKIDFRNTQVTPYQSAHEKLIELGYERVDTHYILYKKNNGIHIEIDSDLTLMVYKENDDFYYTSSPVYINLQLSRILTQYLEELEAKE